MYSPQIQRTSCFSYFESPNFCLQSKWFVVALAISSLVFLGAAALGGTGLFASNLPQWLTHAVGTIGHSGCLAMLIWGSVLGGACAITAVTLLIRRNNEESIETLNTRLIDAARNGQIEEITTLLDRGANIEARDQDGLTPLMYAAAYDRVDALTILLERRANIEATNRRGWTVIDHASTPEARQVLLNRRNELETLNIRLIDAARNGQTEEITTLLDQGANIEASGYDRWTSLMWAANEGEVEAITTLLDQGANIEARDQEGKTSLIVAVYSGHVDAVTTLLHGGANIEARDENGLTPLMVAARNGHNEVVTALLRGGANIEARNLVGSTPLLLATVYNHDDVIRTLLDQGANIDAIHNEGITVIDCATGRAREILLNRRNELNTMNARLIDAARNGQTEEITILLDRGANINATDHEGRTAIDHASTPEVHQALLNWREAHTNN